MAAADAATLATPANSAPIRLFLMINNFETGGSERQFVVLAQNIDASKFRVHPGCVNTRGPLASELGAVPKFPLGTSLMKWRAMRSRFELAYYLRSHRIQIAHSFDFYTNLSMIPVARLARIPIVIGSHRQLGDLLTPFQFRTQLAVFRFCDAVVFNSQAGAERLAAAGLPREKIAVIGNALPSAAFYPAPPALLPIASPRVTMVARMNSGYKNHSGFLRIAAAIHQRISDAEFLLVGDGPLRAEIEQQAAALNLAGRVQFLGDRRDIPALLASTDVAVLTSDSEGLSNVILEAMAAGVPAVAYAVGGNPELITADRGILVSPGNESEFAAAVCRLLAEPTLRRQQGENARQFAEQNFSLAHVCRQYEDLYMRLLNRKLRRSMG